MNLLLTFLSVCFLCGIVLRKRTLTFNATVVFGLSIAVSGLYFFLQRFL
jgi:hypothetical protein